MVKIIPFSALEKGQLFRVPGGRTRRYLKVRDKAFTVNGDGAPHEVNGIMIAGNKPGLLLNFAPDLKVVPTQE